MRVTVIEPGFPGGAISEDPACQCRRCKRLVLDPSMGKFPRRREWLPTPVFLPGDFHRQRTLVSYGLHIHKELDMHEAT